MCCETVLQHSAYTILYDAMQCYAMLRYATLSYTITYMQRRHARSVCGASHDVLEDIHGDEQEVERVRELPVFAVLLPDTGNIMYVYIYIYRDIHIYIYIYIYIYTYGRRKLFCVECYTRKYVRIRTSSQVQPLRTAKRCTQIPNRRRKIFCIDYLVPLCIPISMLGTL